MNNTFGVFLSEQFLEDVGMVEIGIFESKIRKQPKKGLKSFAQGQARRVSNTLSSQSTADVLERLDNKYGIIEKPLENQNTTEYKVFIESIIDYAETKNDTTKNRVKNALKAVVVKPILKSKYGLNTKKTAENKGFNKFLVDTGQTIKAIEVKINDK